MYKSYAALSVALLLSCNAAYAIDTEYDPNGKVAQLYQAQQYVQAADLGLEQLLSEPWNHTLRFLVADSLQRAGRYDEAATQFSALEGTVYAERAMLRLNALRTNTPPTAAIQLTGIDPNVGDAATPQPDSAPQPTAKTFSYTLVSPEQVTTSRHSPSQQRIYDLYTSGDYQATGSEGLELFKTETPNDELRLEVANSLAWTGRMDQAESQYKMIGLGRYSNDARIGLANTYRWRGRDDKALPIYQEVLGESPNDAAALQGVKFAQREMRPRTRISYGGSNDSSPEDKRPTVIDHRWRDATGQQIFGLETGVIRQHQNQNNVNQLDFTARYQNLELPFQPKFELSQQVQPKVRLYGSVAASFADKEVTVVAGHDNWGKLAATTQALKSSLSSNHLGIAANHIYDFGQLFANADIHAISDGNRIVTTKLDYKPAWTPLGNHVKPFIGMETRDARNNSLAYWSPSTGFGTAYAGLQVESGQDEWSLFGAGQLGTRLYGEAGNNWSLSAGGKYWLTQDIAIDLSLWKMLSWRNNSTYRAKSFNLGVEKLWD